VRYALSNRPHPFHASIPLFPCPPELANAIETADTPVSHSTIPADLIALPQCVDGQCIDNREHLYTRFQRLLKLLRQNPRTVRCAAGACEGGNSYAHGKGGHG
jgi:hypothetical protein